MDKKGRQKQKGAWYSGYSNPGKSRDMKNFVVLEIIQRRKLPQKVAELHNSLIKIHFLKKGNYHQENKEVKIKTQEA